MGRYWRETETDVARRPHPYFGKLNRLEEACKAAPGKGRRSEPAIDPGAERGVLWEALRRQD